MGLALFAVLLVAACLVLSFWIDSATLGRRKALGRRLLLNRSGARARLAKLVLGGVVVPASAFAAANLLHLPDRRTPMTVAAELKLPGSGPSRVEQLGRAVLETREPAARAAGIAALRSSGANDALPQLLLILDRDPAALDGGQVSQALSKAIASCGPQALPELVRRFRAVASTGPAAAPRPLYARYLAPQLEALDAEVARLAGDDDARTAARERLAAARTDVKRALDEIEATLPRAADPRDVRTFVLSTLLLVESAPDSSVLDLARRTVEQQPAGDDLRGLALLLVARHGGKGDLDLLYAQLRAGSPSLRSRAFEAIGALQARLGSGSGRG